MSRYLEHTVARTMIPPHPSGPARSRPLTRIAVFVVLGALVPACAGDRPDRATSAPADSTSASGPEQATGLADVTRDSTGAIPIQGRLSEYRIELFPIELKSGAVAVTLRNEGERVHTIEIRGDNAMRWRTFPIRPGTSVTLRMNLDPGRYLVRSTEPPYVDRGMSALLLVR